MEDIMGYFCEKFESVGTKPVLLYAMKKTGMIMGPPGVTAHTDAQREEWDEAVEEFYDIQEMTGETPDWRAVDYAPWEE